MVSFEHRCGRWLHKRTRSGLGTRQECYFAWAKFLAEELQSRAENGEVAPRSKVRDNGQNSHTRKNNFASYVGHASGVGRGLFPGSFISCCERSLAGNNSLIPVCLTHSFLRACCCESRCFHNRFNLILASTLPSTWIWRQAVSEQPFLETPPAQLYSIPIGMWL